MELKIDKKLIDEAVQKAVEELKQNYIWIPKGMTNGDVIKILFPNVGTNFSNVIDLNLCWNAQYKKGGKEDADSN